MIHIKLEVREIEKDHLQRIYIKKKTYQIDFGMFLFMY
ncbi:hypothetical protein MY9_2645 [Bacillus sp. JS]|nr:hypothetical protein MY9_2645 [Bacillus sp. JS]